MVKNQGYSMTYSHGYSHSTTISHVEDLGVPPWRWTWHALGLYLDQGSRMPVHGDQISWEFTHGEMASSPRLGWKGESAGNTHTCIYIYMICVLYVDHVMYKHIYIYTYDSMCKTLVRACTLRTFKKTTTGCAARVLVEAPWLSLSRRRRPRCNDLAPPEGSWEVTIGTLVSDSDKLSSISMMVTVKEEVWLTISINTKVLTLRMINHQY